MTQKTSGSDGGGSDIRRMLAFDTLGSVFINAGAFPGILWFVGLAPPTDSRGGLSDAVMAVGLAVGLMTVILSLVLRARFRRASAAPVISVPLPPAMPRNLVSRTLLLVAVAVIVLAPLRVGICLLLDLYPLSTQSFTILNVGTGIIIALVFTPLVCLSAMSDAAA